MSPWSNWIAAACLPDHCNCEAVRAAWIAQPSAFWSSGAYLIAWIVLWLKRRQFSDGFKVWMLAFFILACASHFAHGSMTEVAMACDFGAICLLLLTPPLLHLRFGQGSNAWIGFTWVLLFGILSAAFYGSGKRIKIGVALCVFGTSVLEQTRTYQNRVRERGFKKALGLIVASFVWFLWDEAKHHCEPESWLQGHSVWHIGSAWAIAEYGKWRFVRQTESTVQIDS
jgi:glycerol uptake facilitator-like aquaporin